ncbi:hypothetical protein F2Q68_00006776 [Brassica cretica]|uniref:Uncharacterized protein n=1 Tax=Brassica cretica TaxID=69181 RepID=A0A8S9JHL5_BRACR|nr:hypothetical protein F2Q68_00006776 [Brassica cretica]
MTLNITPNSNPFIIHYNVLEKELDSNLRSKLTNYSTVPDGMLDVEKRLFYANEKLRERSVHAELWDGLIEEELRKASFVIAHFIKGEGHRRFQRHIGDSLMRRGGADKMMFLVVTGN